MSEARYIVGHVFDVIESLPDESIDLALSSPPFFALRSYLTDDDPLKQWEIGTEATPGEFIDTLLRLVEAITPKLAPHGSLAFELGDTYAGSGGAGGDYADDGLRAGQNRVDGSARRSRGDWAPRPPRRVMNGRTPLDKSLCLIPELFRVALVYGLNPLTGRETPQWRARNVVRWCRPNPSVGAIGDKYRTATSDMVVVCKSKQRYFDGDAVRVFDKSEAGRPLYDWWEIGTAGYEGAHFAVWPDDLCVAPIKSMTPALVCRTCGKPQQRIVERQNESQGNTAGGKGRNGRQVADVEYSVVTVGWTDCGHGSIVCGSCGVLVPYDHAVRRPSESAGSQTTKRLEEVLGEPIESAGQPTQYAGVVRAVRDQVHGPAGGEVLHSQLFGEAGTPRGPSEHDQAENTHTGPEVPGGGLRARVGATGNPGSDREWADDGAPPGDAEPPRSSARTARDRSPSKRDQARQPGRELGDRDAYDAPGDGDVPALSDDIRGQLIGYVCPCGSSSFKYVEDHWRRGMVLDPFAGSGTTLAVATGLGRDAIGVDLDPRNADLAVERCGMFVTVDVFNREPVAT